MWRGGGRVEGRLAGVVSGRGRVELERERERGSGGEGRKEGHTHRLLFDVETRKVDGGAGSEQVCQLLFSEWSGTGTSWTPTERGDGACREGGREGTSELLSLELSPRLWSAATASCWVSGLREGVGMP